MSVNRGKKRYMAYYDKISYICHVLQIGFIRMWERCGILQNESKNLWELRQGFLTFGECTSRLKHIRKDLDYFYYEIPPIWICSASCFVVLVTDQTGRQEEKEGFIWDIVIDQPNEFWLVFWRCLSLQRPRQFPRSRRKGMIWLPSRSN